MSGRGAEQTSRMNMRYKMDPIAKVFARLGSPHRFQSHFDLHISLAAVTVLTLLTLVGRPTLQLRKCQHRPQCQVQSWMRTHICAAPSRAPAFTALAILSISLWQRIPQFCGGAAKLCQFLVCCCAHGGFPSAQTSGAAQSDCCSAGCVAGYATTARAVERTAALSLRP